MLPQKNISLTSLLIASSLHFTAITSMAVEEAVPNLQSSADRELPDGRNITIHREAKIGPAKANAIYFHRPIFAFIENKKGDTDHPIIWDKMEEDGHIYISVKLVLSTPEFAELARATVAKEDSALRIEKPAIHERNVEVKAWPLKALRLEIRHSLTNKLYGSSIIKELRTEGNDVVVSLQISNEQYPEFMKALQSNQVEFSPSYTFSNAIVAFGQSATNITGTVSTAISNTMASQRLNEGDPIFQNDARKLSSELDQLITTTIRANDPSVLAHIKPQDISGHILKSQPLTFSSVEGNANLLSKVSAYLAPIVKKMHEDSTTTDKTTDTKETTTDNKIKINFKDLLGSTFDLSDKQVKTLETIHGVELKKSTDTSIMQPHSIEVQYIRKGWQKNLLSVFQTVYLAVGNDKSFQADSAFKASFTVDSLNTSIKNKEILISPYDGVPKGVPMLSFRADIPKGWVALDGIAKWPTNENWVPKHLRGKPVPNLKGSFARGSTDNEKIGSVYVGGRFVINESVIKGSDFKMTQNGTGGVLDKTGPLQIYKLANKGHAGASDVFVSGGYVTSGWTAPKRATRRGSVKPPAVNSKQTKQFTGDITGSYKFSGHDWPLDEPQNQPPHVVGQWIMRIE